MRENYANLDICAIILNKRYCGDNCEFKQQNEEITSCELFKERLYKEKHFLRCKACLHSEEDYNRNISELK